MRLSELRDGFIHLLYPRLCEGCNKPLIAAEQVLCISCATELPETDYHALDDNETALRFAGRVPFFRATSFAYFTEDGLLQHLLHRLKYKDRQEIGDYLGSRFAESLAAANWLSGIDIIIPVPLHASRQAERGYNQSMLIAAAIGRQAAIPATDAALLRVRETESQTRKSRTERTENMAGAFLVADDANLKGKHILIIDDVLTTGATIEACVTALKAVENVKISIATIGIAVS